MARNALVIGRPQDQPAWLAAALGRDGGTILAAADAQSATVRSRHARPSMVVLLRPANAPYTLGDLNLLRLHPSTAALPIILVSNAGGPVDVVKMLKAGVTKVVRNPEDADAFAQLVDTAMGGPGVDVAPRSSLERRGPAVLRRMGSHLSRMHATGTLTVGMKDRTEDVAFLQGHVANLPGVDGGQLLQALLGSPADEPWTFEFSPNAHTATLPAGTPPLPATPPGAGAKSPSLTNLATPPSSQPASPSRSGMPPPLPAGASMSTPATSGPSTPSRMGMTTPPSSWPSSPSRAAILPPFPPTAPSGALRPAAVEAPVHLAPPAHVPTFAAHAPLANPHPVASMAKKEAVLPAPASGGVAPATWGAPAPVVAAAPSTRPSVLPLNQGEWFTPGSVVAATAAVPPLPPPTPAEAALAPPVRVLVVDDEPSLLEIYTQFLRRSGMIVWTAPDGKAGYKMASEVWPDVILSDMMMPKLDGWGLLTLVRDEPRLRECRFLLNSCHGDYLTGLRDLEAGADDYLEKGLSHEKLCARITASVAPRRDLLAALKRDVAFSGHVGAVGIQHLLGGLGRVGASGVLEVQDSMASYQLTMDRGLLMHCVVKMGAARQQGVTALLSLLGVDEAPYTFNPVNGDRTLSLGYSFQDVRDLLCRTITRRRTVEFGDMLTKGGSIRMDPAMLQFYLQFAAEDSRPLINALEHGTAVAKLMPAAKDEALRAEWIIKDLLRRGIGQVVMP